MKIKKRNYRHKIANEIFNFMLREGINEGHELLLKLLVFANFEAKYTNEELEKIDEILLKLKPKELIYTQKNNLIRLIR